MAMLNNQMVMFPHTFQIYNFSIYGSAKQNQGSFDHSSRSRQLLFWSCSSAYREDYFEGWVSGSYKLYTYSTHTCVYIYIFIYIYIYTYNIILYTVYIYIHIYLHKGKTDWISGLSNCLLWMRICTYQLFFLLQGIQDCPYIQYYIYDIIYIVFLSFQNTWYELHKIGEFTMVGVRKTSRYELKAILVQIMPGLTMTLHTSTGQ